MEKCLHIIPRKIAIEKGIAHSFRGLACKNGNISERYAKSGACLCEDCRLQRSDSRREYRKSWYEKNKSHVLEKTKIRQMYTSKHKKSEYSKRSYRKRKSDPKKYQQIKESSNQWKRKNKEKVKAYGEIWRLKNRDHQRNYSKQYAKDNREIVNSNNAKRRARRSMAAGSYTATDIQNLLTAQRQKCASCHCNLKKTGYHVDHVIPLARGGTNWPDNLQILCPACNLSKGAKDPYEWAQENGRLL